jgi:hypothetical protein
MTDRLIRIITALAVAGVAVISPPGTSMGPFVNAAGD